jgi:uncharacterized protein
MVIREMSREECLRVLAGAKVARLACAYENQPYVLPVTLAYPGTSGGGDCLYGFTTPGQKIEWMRANPLVCVEVDEVPNANQWVSVIAFGRYEELPGEETPDPQGRPDERLVAHQILQSHAMWWATASAAHAARVHRDLGAPLVPVFYRVRMSKITGHEATREASDGIASTSAQKPCWLRRALQRVYGHKS